MKRYHLLGLSLIAGLLGCALVACHRETGPPPPLAVEQIPAEFKKAFGSASGELKSLADLVVETVQTNNYPDAFQAVQQLCSLSDGTKEQKSLAARAHLTLSGLLQTSQAQGDQKAAEVLLEYKRSK